jgi:hypothetical protein
MTSDRIASSLARPPALRMTCASPSASPAYFAGVADEQRAGIEGQRLEAGVDDRAVLGRAAHHRRPDKRLGSKTLVGSPPRSRLRS